MSEIRLQQADYLKCRGFNAEKLVEAVSDAVEPEIIYQLVEKDIQQRQIDLSILAAVLDGLSKLNGFPMGVGEVLV